VLEHPAEALTALSHPDAMNGSRAVGGLGLVALFLFIPERGACTAGAASFEGASIPVCGSGPTAPAGSRVSLSGWFHVIWNAEPHFLLIDDRGVATALLIDEALLTAAGGARGLNRKRVTVVGQQASEAREVVRVLSIQPERERK
jgi:hypothetical protein